MRVFLQTLNLLSRAHFCEDRGLAMRTLVAFMELLGEASLEDGVLYTGRNLRVLFMEKGYPQTQAFRMEKLVLECSWAFPLGPRLCVGGLAGGVDVFLVLLFVGEALSCDDFDAAKAAFMQTFRGVRSREDFFPILKGALARVSARVGEEVSRSLGYVPAVPTVVVEAPVTTPEVVEEEKPKKRAKKSKKSKAAAETTSTGQGLLALTGGTTRKVKKKTVKKTELAVYELESIWRARMREAYPSIPVPAWPASLRYKASQALQAYSDPKTLHNIVRYVIGNWETILQRKRWIQDPYPSVAYVMNAHVDFAGEASLVQTVEDLEARMKTWMAEHPTAFSPPEELMRELSEAKRQMARIGGKA